MDDSATPDQASRQSWLKRTGTWLVTPYSGSRPVRLLKWCLFPGLVVVLIIALGVWVTDDANGAAPQQAPATQLCEVPKATAESAGTICPAYVKTKVRQFRKGKLGNAKGVVIPKFFRKRLWNHINAKGMAKDGNWGWITEPLKATSCLVTNPTGTHRGTCDEGQKSVNRTLKKVDKILLICGSAGFAGSLRGGGSIGAGLTAGFCLWNFWIEFAF